jgi:hypothetical protein
MAKHFSNRSGDWSRVMLAVFLLAPLVFPASASAEEGVGTAARNFGHAVRDAGKAIGQGAKQVGRQSKGPAKEVGHGFRDGAVAVGHGFRDGFGKGGSSARPTEKRPRSSKANKQPVAPSAQGKGTRSSAATKAPAASR